MSKLLPVEAPNGNRVYQSHPESDADEQMDSDRNWFKSHPNASYYYRKPFDCEYSMFPSPYPERTLKKIKVMLTDVNGIRIKQPVYF